MTSHLPHASRPLAAVITALVLVLALGACSDSGSDPNPTDAMLPSATAGSDPDAICGVHKVGDVQVRTFCGEGTASAKGGGVDLELDKATCETADDYVSVNAGTLVLGGDEDAATALKAETSYIGLNVGRVPGDSGSKPATEDGTYTGGVLSVTDGTIALLPQAAELEVTLTDNRTKGTFSAPLLGSGTVTGSFSCG